MQRAGKVEHFWHSSSFQKKIALNVYLKSVLTTSGKLRLFKSNQILTLAARIPRQTAFFGLPSIRSWLRSIRS